MLEFPEVDRAEWFELAEAREKINGAQAELIEVLRGLIGGRERAQGRNFRRSRVGF